MLSETTPFDAGAIAAVGSILGVAYLFGAMLAVLSNGEAQFMLLSGSVPVTGTVGVMLSLMSGLLATGHRFGRIIGTTAFGAVLVFGFPNPASPDPIETAVAVVALVLTGYMILRNPVPKPQKSKIDESTSASRVGSTLR